MVITSTGPFMIDSSRTLVLLTPTVTDTLHAIMPYASHIRGEIRLALPGYIPGIDGVVGVREKP